VPEALPVVSRHDERPPLPVLREEGGRVDRVERQRKRVSLRLR
jgi:hypothetical protein